MHNPTTGSRVIRVRHEIQRREAEVIRVEELSPNFRSVTFRGEAFASFRSDGFDDHVKFILPGVDVKESRDYTPRSFDPEKRELTIEFALHGHGAVSNWAAAAQLGQQVTIAGPRGSMIVPMDYAWYVLVGDDTALPAIARRLEELPPQAVVTVLATTADPADRRQFRSEANLSVSWADTEQALLDLVAAFQLPAGEGYVWCGAESAIAATVREIFVEQKGHDKDAIRSSSYWKRGAEQA